jgi:RHS repeat-associated protein
MVALNTAYAAPKNAADPKNRVGDFFYEDRASVGKNRWAKCLNAQEKSSYHYETASGRSNWSNRDPIQEQGGLNLYAMVSNNAVNIIDLFGLKGSSECTKGSATAETTGNKIADEALKLDGSTDYSVSSEIDNFPEDTWKCNKFVNDVGDNAGAEVPDINGYPGNRYPPTANQWADPEHNIPGWNNVVDNPEPGDVAAIGKSNSSGHVGIVTGENQTTSAAHQGVVTNDWGFREGQNPTFRRHDSNMK